jgi:hypothetical protein
MDINYIKEALKFRENSDVFPEAGKIKENALHPFFEDEIKKLREIADEELAIPPALPLFSHYKIFDTAGTSEEYKSVYFNVRKRLNAFFIMYLITDETKYKTALEDEIWLICDMYTWASPTVMGGDSLNVKGIDGRINQKKFLDLWSTETAFTLAEMDYILGDKLSDFIRHRMREETYTRVLSHYTTNDPPFRWEIRDNNWAAVCGGSIGAAAIYYIKDNALLAEYILRVLGTLDIFLRGYDEDGACLEGASYWEYGISYYVFFGELLKNRTGGKIDLLQTEHFHNMALFLQRCRINDDLVINFSDCIPYMWFRVGTMHKLKELFSDVQIPPLKYSLRFNADHNYRFAGFIRDFAWLKSEYLVEEEDVLSDGYYFKTSQLYISRKNDVFFAVTGGDNGRSHNHNDLGHFIYFVGNKGVFVDIGMGIYNKQYFSEGRYEIINNSAKGHSLPQINGNVQLPGKEYRVSDFKVDGDTVTMDLTNAYGCKELESLKRTFEFFRNGNLKITDEIRLNAKSQVLEQFLIDVTEEPKAVGNSIVLTKDDVRAEFRFNSNLIYIGYEKIPPGISKCPVENMYILQFIADVCDTAAFTFEICSLADIK